MRAIRLLPKLELYPSAHKVFLGLFRVSEEVYYYSSHEQLAHHLNDFVLAYNFARRLKALGGKTPGQFIEEQ